MTKAVEQMPPTRRIDGRGGKVQWWIAAAVMAGIVVVILISLPARDTHIPPQPTPPVDDNTGGQDGAGQGKGSQMGGFTLKSSAFENGAPIPAEYTADGANTSPPLTISGLPEGTVTMALIVDDPDAPSGTWVHWVMWNIPVNALEIAPGAVPAGAMQGKNSGGKQFYSGPAPPSGKHRYFFTLYALDQVIQLSATATKRELIHAMDGHIIAQVTLIGTYTREK